MINHDSRIAASSAAADGEETDLRSSAPWVIDWAIDGHISNGKVSVKWGNFGDRVGVCFGVRVPARPLVDDWICGVRAREGCHYAGKKRCRLSKSFGTANGNRTRILALKGLRANRCTIAALEKELYFLRIRDLGGMDKRPRTCLENLRAFNHYLIQQSGSSARWQ